MDYFGRENEWQSHLQVIAAQFLNDDRALTREMDLAHVAGGKELFRIWLRAGNR